jgi:hypothetical protein
MITVENYFRAYAGHPEITAEIRANAEKLLYAVNDLLVCAMQQGVTLRTNPATGTFVSGQDNGGWRPQACPIGAPTSSHKTGRGVDVADHDGTLDAWITDQCLADFNLYREHPDATLGWCHLTSRAPGSGHRTFFP